MFIREKEFRNTEKFSWMDWMIDGIPSTDGKITPWSDGNCPYIDAFYVPTKDSSWAPPVNKKWVRVKIRKINSNLNLYQVHCSGDDDCSYSFDIIGRIDTDKEILWLQAQNNLTINKVKSRGYYFTN